MHHDTAEEKVHIEVVQDVGPALERAKAMRNDTELKKRGIRQGWMHAALLPDGIVHRWMNEKRIPREYLSKEGQEAIMKILRTDPDYQYLKTVDGKI